MITTFTLPSCFTPDYCVVIDREAESAKSLERRALTAPEQQTNGNGLSVSVVIEKPGFLKLGRKTRNTVTTTTTTTSTSCHLDNESAL